MSRARERARDFLEREQAFRLGELPTEASHPATRELSQTIQTDIRAGIRMLQSVDRDIPDMLERLFAAPEFEALAGAIHDAIGAGRRIFFTGCGATGRLGILLEAAWRRFWGGLEDRHPEWAEMANRCISVMAGGDFALIKSVEGFEDFPDFGRYQLRQAGVRSGDVVVAITEGGETPFVIGTAWEGLERGAEVFFVYNNPTDVLRANVQRSREVIEEPRIHKLDLTTGPMAIMGSTRMQAVTAELLVVGAAIETAIVRWLQSRRPRLARAEPGLVFRSCEEYRRQFERLLIELGAAEAVDTMARAAHLEEATYRAHGLVTYVADFILLDVLTDTTERSPTFMVPAFRKEGDSGVPVSWAFVKDPRRTTQEAWHQMLQREPRGLDWDRSTYERLNAPDSLRADPPRLNNTEIYRFRIGSEPDPSRTSGSDSVLVFVDVGDEIARDGGLCPPYEAAMQRFTPGHGKTAAITVGERSGSLAVDEHFHIACHLPASPLRLWEHLAVKLVFNTLSTATMARMGRVFGNAMVWLAPSNKKLIDRGTRLIAQTTGQSYESACEALHDAMEDTGRRAQMGEEVPSPVALAIERIRSKGPQNEA